MVDRVWKRFIDKTQRRLVFDKNRRRMAVQRAKERLGLPGADLRLVEDEMTQAIDNLLASDWHRDNGKVNWELVFRSTSLFDEKLGRSMALGQNETPKRLTAAEKFRRTA